MAAISGVYTYLGYANETMDVESVFPSSLYTPIIPKMTSNTEPAPFVISTTKNSDTDYYVIDGVEGTITFDIVNAYDPDTYSIIVDLGSPTSIRGHAASYNDTTGFYETTSDILYGSNDNSTWEIISEVGDRLHDSENKDSGRTYAYLLSENSPAYRYYKLDIVLYGGGRYGNQTYAFQLYKEKEATIKAGNYILQTSTGYLSLRDAQYDSDNHKYNELELTSANVINYSFDISYLTQEVTIGEDTFIPLDKISVPFKIINTNSKDFNTTINGLKSNTELIVANRDFDVSRISAIDNFTVEGGNTNNGNMQVVFSIDSGNTWKTMGNGFDVKTVNGDYNRYIDKAIDIGNDSIYVTGYDYPFIYNVKSNTITKLTYPEEISNKISTPGIAKYNNCIYMYSYGNYYFVKYNIETNEYTKLNKLDDSYINSRNMVLLGDCLYFFGNNNFNTKNSYYYKYDINTDTFTKMGNTPYIMSDSAVSAHGTDVYIFGSSYISKAYTKYAYKYDSLTDTFTRLSDIPFDINFGYAETIDDAIFIYEYIDHKLYKYDILSDSYVEISTSDVDSISTYRSIWKYKKSILLVQDPQVIETDTTKISFNIASYSRNSITDILNINVPLKMQDQLTDEEKTNLNTAKTAIKLVGIPYNELSNIDFNSIDISHLRFAYLFDRPTIDDTVYTNLLKWQFDAYGQMFTLDEESDYSISIENNQAKMKMNNDYSMIKINYMKGGE